MIVAPAGGQQQIHADGELATARAAKAAGNLMIVSTVQQFQRRRGCEGVGTALVPALCLARSEADGETAGRRRGGRLPGRRADRGLQYPGQSRGRALVGPRHRPPKAAAACGSAISRTIRGRRGSETAALTWDTVDWIRSKTRMKLVLKGIVTREDAALAVQARRRRDHRLQSRRAAGGEPARAR